jgi:hypothetical protein
VRMCWQLISGATYQPLNLTIPAGYFEAAGGVEVAPLRLSGTWRAVEAMPLLAQPNTGAPPAARVSVPRSMSTSGAAESGGRRSSLTGSGTPKGGVGPGGEEGQQRADLVREIVAVVGVDDVHLCRVMHAKEHGAPAPFVRLSRLFSLDISKVRLVVLPSSLT